jgi:hypothetical protein
MRDKGIRGSRQRGLHEGNGGEHGDYEFRHVAAPSDLDGRSIRYFDVVHARRNVTRVSIPH